MVSKEKLGILGGVWWAFYYEPKVVLKPCFKFNDRKLGYLYTLPNVKWSVKLAKYIGDESYYGNYKRKI